MGTLMLVTRMHGTIKCMTPGAGLPTTSTLPIPYIPLLRWFDWLVRLVFLITLDQSAAEPYE